MPILLIDSKAHDRNTLSALLVDSALKFDLTEAYSLVEGFELLSKHQFDIVLLDINLTDSQGYKTISTYLERFGHIPAIVVTSNNNDIIASQGAKAGILEYLIKWQFDGKQLGRAITLGLHRFKTIRRLEASVKEFELHKKRFQEAQRMAQLGTWEMDVVTNEMTWSDEVYRIFGFEPGNIKPTLSEYIRCVPMEDRERVTAFFEESGRNGQLHELEHRILLDGIRLRHVHLQAKVQISEGGDKVILVGSVWDITERKLSEKLMIEKAISSQTAKVQEEVLADLGFQIRTPLSSIVNILFLLGNTPISSQQEAYIYDLKTSVNDLSISVNNLLNFSIMVTDNVKVEEEEITIREFLKGAENAVKIKADTAKIGLAFELSELVPDRLSTDPRKLMQVTYNLIEHALRLSNEGESVRVLAECTSLDDIGLNLAVRIRNNKKQFSPGELKELMAAENMLEMGMEETDATLKKRLMGVAIANKLINILGGSFEVRNLERGGFEMLVSVPVKPAKQHDLFAGEAPNAPIRILLVEDHFLNQIATKKVLTSWSDFVSVDIADNGQEGVELFTEGNHDLILMDIQMPVMNGLDAAKKIRKSSNVPIIALTANSTKQEQERCLEIGMNDYLSKPFKPADLYARIMATMMVKA